MTSLMWADRLCFFLAMNQKTLQSTQGLGPKKSRDQLKGKIETIFADYSTERMAGCFAQPTQIVPNVRIAVQPRKKHFPETILVVFFQHGHFVPLQNRNECFQFSRTNMEMEAQFQARGK